MVLLKSGSTLPIGGLTKSQGGEGMFHDGNTNDAISVWINIDLRDRISYINSIKAEGGFISNDHRAESTHILIMSPRSVPIFDMYCHPQWLEPIGRRLYYYRRDRDAKKGKLQDEPWTTKVMVKHAWLRECFAAGRFLGASDNWAGCRVGGQPFNEQLQPVATIEILAPPTAVSVPVQAITLHEEGILHESATSVKPMSAEGALPTVTNVPHTSTTQHTSPTERPTQPAESMGILVDDQMDVDTSALQSVDPDENRKSPSRSHDRTEDEVTGTAQAITNVDEPQLDGEQHSQSSHHKHSAMESEFEEEEEEIIALNPTQRQHVAADVQGPTVAADVDEKIDPSILFEGLWFWVDPAKANRSDLLRRLTGAGGRIATEYEGATHVLISGYSGLAPPAKKHLSQVMRGVTQLGVCFLDIKWAIKCLDEGRRIPEQEYLIPGGRPLGSAVAPAVHSGAEARDAKAALSSDRAGTRKYMGGGSHFKTINELLEIFTKEKHALNSLSNKLAGQELETKYGINSARSWSNMVADNKNSTGRFTKARFRPDLSIFNDDDDESPTDPTDQGPNPIADGDAFLRLGDSHPPSPDEIAVAEQASSSEHAIDTPHDSEQSLGGSAKDRSQPLHALTGVELDLGLEKAYQFLLETGRKRKSIPFRFRLRTGILELPEWIRVYTEYHDRVVRDNMSDEGIHEILTEMKKTAAENKWSNIDPNLQAMARTMKVLDFDGWRERWDQFETGQIEPRRSSSTSRSPAAEPPAFAEKSALNRPDETNRSRYTSKPLMDTNRCTQIFEQHAPLLQNGMSLTELGKKLNKQYGTYPPATWAVFFGQWKRGEGRFAQDIREQERPPTQNKRASDTVTAASSPKKSRNTYSDEEEKEMARYILGRMPEPTRTNPKDWADLALKSKRTAAALAQRYREFRDRIDTMVREMKVNNGKLSRAMTVNSSDDDASVFAVSSPPDDRVIEYVDMTGLDSD